MLAAMMVKRPVKKIDKPDRLENLLDPIKNETHQRPV